MAIIIKTDKEIASLRIAGVMLAEVVAETAARVTPGVTTGELDAFAESKIRSLGAKPAFKGYQPDGADRPFPATLCVSVNDEVVHGIPGERVLVAGDIVSVDCGLQYQGVFTDHAVTVPVGAISPELQGLVTATKEALQIGVALAEPGRRVGDIGSAIEQYVAGRYGIVRVLSGHGVGRYIHEEPYIPNFGRAGTGAILQPGMVIAIEPMLNLGTEEVVFHDDGYTVTTADQRHSAHFEHTVLIGTEGPEILTRLEK